MFCSVFVLHYHTAHTAASSLVLYIYSTRKKVNSSGSLLEVVGLAQAFLNFVVVAIFLSECWWKFHGRGKKWDDWWRVIDLIIEMNLIMRFCGKKWWFTRLMISRRMVEWKGPEEKCKIGKEKTSPYRIPGWLWSLGEPGRVYWIAGSGSGSGRPRTGFENLFLHICYMPDVLQPWYTLLTNLILYLPLHYW